MRFLFACLLLPFLLTVDAACASTPATLGDSAAAASAATKDEAPSNQVVIAPHRAIYDMQLASLKNGGNITGVSGKLVFEWNDVCDGWAVQQHMKLHFNYAEGDDSDITSSEVSWESKDGKKYNFNSHHMTNGKETEVYRGKATLTADGGKVIYTLPKKKTEDLSPGTMFPSSHTILILQKAIAGERIFTRHVFDGTDEDGSSDVSAFINPAIAQKQEIDADPKLSLNPLLGEATWPVRMAFFKNNSETGEPDYEMDLALLSNGIVKKMRIDYGDFAVTGTLREIESLPSGCSM